MQNIAIASAKISQTLVCEMQLCYQCEQEQTASTCSNCEKPACDDCKAGCGFCTEILCLDCTDFCYTCSTNDKRIETCILCSSECKCHGRPFCPNCAPKPCSSCLQVWCEDGEAEHLGEHQRRFVLIYMALALGCNRIVLETLGWTMKYRLFLL